MDSFLWDPVYKKNKLNDKIHSMNTRQYQLTNKIKAYKIMVNRMPNYDKFYSTYISDAESELELISVQLNALNNKISLCDFEIGIIDSILLPVEGVRHILINLRSKLDKVIANTLNHKKEYKIYLVNNHKTECIYDGPKMSSLREDLRDFLIFSGLEIKAAHILGLNIITGSALPIRYRNLLNVVDDYDPSDIIYSRSRSLELKNERRKNQHKTNHYGRMQNDDDYSC